MEKTIHKDNYKSFRTELGLKEDKGLSKSIDLHNECTDSYISDWYLAWFENLSEDEQRDTDPELYAETQRWKAEDLASELGCSLSESTDTIN